MSYYRFHTAKIEKIYYICFFYQPEYMSHPLSEKRYLCIFKYHVNA